MSSPFSNSKEFLEAKGPIYTFANNPTAIAIFLLLSFAITVYFFYASYAMYRKDGKGRDPALMSVFLVAGLATSMASSLMGTPKKQPVTAYQQDTRSEQRVAHRNTPVGMLLGLAGIGAGAMKGKPKYQRRSPRKTRRHRL
jgi:hypothetical protein